MSKRLSIRWKLTLWYGSVLAVVLAAFGTIVFVMMRHHLLQRIDQGLHEELSDVLSEIKRARSPEGLKEWLQRRFAEHAGFDFQITRENGERYFFNSRLADQAWPLPTRLSESHLPSFETIPIRSKGAWRIVEIRVQGPDGPLMVQVGRSLAALEHELSELLMTFLIAGPLTLLVAICGGYFLACQVLQPMQVITRSAKSISADRLSERIDIANPDDELGELAQTLNQMIERLERSFTEMQRFTADAAHELRTPLAIIRSEAEIALRLPRSSDEYCDVLGNLLEDTNRLSTLADELLFLSRYDAGVSVPGCEAVEIHALLLDVVNNMKPVAHGKEVSISLIENAECHVTADRQILRVFYNLIDNAIKNTEPAGRITVSSRAIKNEVTIRVSDSGCGIAAEHLPRIFDRFYRVDPSRTTTGAGLGLAICQCIVRSCGGTIRAESIVGQGTSFIVSLPITSRIST